MDYFKEAAKRSLIVETLKGPLNPSQLYKLSISELASEGRKLEKQLKEYESGDSFSEAVSEAPLNLKIAYSVVKAIYDDKKEDADKSAVKADIKKQIAEIDRLEYAAKQKEMESWSAEKLAEHRKTLEAKLK